MCSETRRRRRRRREKKVEQEEGGFCTFSPGYRLSFGALLAKCHILYSYTIEKLTALGNKIVTVGIILVNPSIEQSKKRKRIVGATYTSSIAC